MDSIVISVVDRHTSGRVRTCGCARRACVRFYVLRHCRPSLAPVGRVGVLVESCVARGREAGPLARGDSGRGRRVSRPATSF